MPDAETRLLVEGIYRADGLAGLQAALGRRDPDRLAAMRDRSNPRRLMRALELSLCGHAGGRAPRRRLNHPAVPGLRPAPDLLRQRIQERVQRMYAAGLVDEVARLQAAGLRISVTAGQAIGYAEATAVLEGALPWEEAVARTVTRTRRLAKRQMTWFSHQADVRWIDVTPAMTEEEIAEQVREHWRRLGPLPVAVS